MIWVVLSIVAVPLLYAAAAACIWTAITTARTPQGSVAWVVFLVSFPPLAVPLFLILGRRRYPGYVIARTDSARAVREIDAFGAAHPPHAPVSPMARAMEKLAHLPLVSGNDVDLLIDGEETFAAIFAAIDAAQRYVLVQFYILRSDGAGQALADRLKAAAGRGVTVRLLFDAVGSNALPRRFLNEMRAAGVDVVNPDEIRGPTSRLEINFRNHRKAVIVDGQTGFIGGFNVGDEYLGKSEKFGPWRDTFARVTGPIVAQMQLVFLEDWHFATRDLLEDLDWSPRRADADMNALILATGPGDATETGALFFFNAITSARTRVWLASPYFVPDIDILSAIKMAALRGVDVRILVPHVIDHKMPWLAAFGYFDEVMEAGAQVWRYDDGFLHHKAVLVDDEMFALGTTNLDNRSFRLNFEAMALIFDPRAAAAGKAMFEADLARAWRLEETLSQQPRWIRIGAPIARLFAPLL